MKGFSTKSCKRQFSNVKQTCQIVSSKIKNDRVLDNAFVLRPQQKRRRDVAILWAYRKLQFLGLAQGEGCVQP